MCVCVCVCVCACVCVHVCVHVCVRVTVCLCVCLCEGRCELKAFQPGIYYAPCICQELGASIHHMMNVNQSSKLD